MNATASDAKELQGSRLYIFLLSLNIVLSLAANLFVLLVLQLQNQLEDTTKLLYRVLFCFRIALSVSWSTWDLVLHTISDIYTCTLLYMVTLYAALTCLSTIMFIISLLSLEKYVFLSYPLRYHIFVTTKRIKSTLLVMFCMSCLTCFQYPTVPNFRDTFKSRCSGTDIFDLKKLTLFRKVNEIHIASLIGIACGITTVANAAIIRLAYRQSRLVEIARNHDIPRSFHSSEVHEAVLRNHPPNGRPRRNRGVVSIVILTFSFYISWIIWAFYVLLPDSVRQIIDYGTGANCGWLQPLLYLVTTKEARDIIKRRLKFC